MMTETTDVNKGKQRRNVFERLYNTHTVASLNRRYRLEVPRSAVTECHPERHRMFDSPTLYKPTVAFTRWTAAYQVSRFGGTVTEDSYHVHGDDKPIRRALREQVYGHDYVTPVKKNKASAAPSTPPTTTSRTPSPRQRHPLSGRSRRTPPMPRVQTPARHQRKMPPTPLRSKPPSVAAIDGARKTAPTPSSPKAAVQQHGRKYEGSDELNDLLDSERSEEEKEHQVSNTMTKENNPQEEEIIFDNSDHDDAPNDHVQDKQAANEPTDDLEVDLDDLLATDRSEDDVAV